MSAPEHPNAPRVIPHREHSHGPLIFSVLLHAGLIVFAGGLMVSQGELPRLFSSVSEPAPDLLLETPESGPPHLDDRPEPTTGPGQDDAPSALVETGLALDTLHSGTALDLLSARTDAQPALTPRGPSLQGMGALQPGSGLGFDGTGERAGRRGSGSVLGMNIFAKRLGVLLDISGSMFSSLPAVVAQIDANFNDYILVLVNGCWIRSSTRTPTFSRYFPQGDATELDLTPGLTQLLGGIRKPIHYNTRADAGEALAAMASTMNVDSIYWFADFQDTVEPKRMAGLADLLRQQGIRLYVHSVDARPHPAIRAAVSRTGGRDQVQKVP